MKTYATKKIYITTTIVTLISVLFFNLSYAKGLHKYSMKTHSFNDQARVIKVKAIYDDIEVHRPEEKCYQEKITYNNYEQPNNNYAGIITGGIIGGVAGHQIGGGRGKDVATVAGTLIGAIIGDNVSNNHRPRYRKHKKHSRYERHCDTIDSITTHQEIIGYRVKYRYKGHNYWTKTRHHPGRYIGVNVNVRPLG